MRTLIFIIVGLAFGATLATITTPITWQWWVLISMYCLAVQTNDLIIKYTK